MNYPTFRTILCNLSLAIDDKPIPSAHKVIKRNPRGPDALNEEWWLSNDKNSSPDKSRRRAFVLTYIAAFGTSFDARGGRLDDGSYVHWDKGIFKCLLKEEMLEMRENQLNLTPKGLSFVKITP